MVSERGRITTALPYRRRHRNIKEPLAYEAVATDAVAVSMQLAKRVEHVAGCCGSETLGTSCKRGEAKTSCFVLCGACLAVRPVAGGVGAKRTLRRAISPHFTRIYLTS